MDKERQKKAIVVGKRIDQPVIVGAQQLIVTVV